MSLMNRFRNPLAGAWQRAGPDLKYVGFRGFLDALTTAPQVPPDTCEVPEWRRHGQPCE